MEPDWTKAPEWANYFTMNIRGIFTWWETEPTYDFFDGIYFSVEGKGEAAGRLNIPKPFMRERPK